MNLFIITLLIQKCVCYREQYKKKYALFDRKSVIYQRNIMIVKEIEDRYPNLLHKMDILEREYYPLKTRLSMLESRICDYISVLQEYKRKIHLYQITNESAKQNKEQMELLDKFKKTSIELRCCENEKENLLEETKQIRNMINAMRMIAEDHSRITKIINYFKIQIEGAKIGCKDLKAKAQEQFRCEYNQILETYKLSPGMIAFIFFFTFIVFSCAFVLLTCFQEKKKNFTLKKE
jgi:hypothetical protein